MNLLFFPIVIPFIAGFFCLFSPRRLREFWAILGSLATFALAIFLFNNTGSTTSTFLRLDSLSNFILLFIGLFGFLITLYSLKFMEGKKDLRQYYTYILWSIGASSGAVLANHLILFLVFWGFLGITLYLLINIEGQKATYAAKKTFIIVGGGDALILLGIGIIWHLKGSFQMDAMSISFNSGLAYLAYISLILGAFTKVGAMPLHSWIPDCAQVAPQSMVAFLPGALDKLLGIYLLARVSLDIFIINQIMGLVLMIIGAITIIASVMMALVQEEIKRLIAYLSISSAGYMLVAIACGNPIGIAGGLFYLISTSIWTSLLFLCTGAVERSVGTTEFSQVGGLAKLMPITFITALIAGLSVSGVPPFNGFISKWMVYQGIIELGKSGDRLWIVWLVVAMFGSALTLACFMKLIHAAFLGQLANWQTGKPIHEVHWTMWSPMVVLAGLCILFGVFAYQVPLRFFISPFLSTTHYQLSTAFIGFWSPGLATLLIIVGILMGVIIYCVGNLKKALREDSSFIGGETLPAQARITGVDFYNTIKEIKPFRVIYRKAEDKLFDIYDQGTRFIAFFTKKLQYIHTGELPRYLSWCLLGLAVVFFILVL
jgi:formate hydrogenlyase subunit 3/multisubunit Na+/H+ antiporter MnhD subunit